MSAEAALADHSTADAPSGPRAQMGLAALARRVFEGRDLAPLSARLIHQATSDLTDASAMLDLSTLAILTGDRAAGLNLQQQALRRQQLYRRPAPAKPSLTLLAIAAPGDMMANTPLDFLIEGADIELLTLYIVPGIGIPAELPDHDLAFLAVGESEANFPLLQALAPILPGWPRPLLNNSPRRIAELTRDGVCALTADIPGLLAPSAQRVDRATLAAWSDFPIIARPIGSHAGAGLSKCDTAAEVAAYLAEQPAERFYVSPFIDYAAADGLFRKQRIALIGGKPFLCHHAVSARWMVHYMNAAMLESEENRAEEARMMATFDEDFAVRHGAAFEGLSERIGLDYFAIDCGETRDGQLLLFEADVAMIVHDMDPPDLFPYKKPQMRKVMAAFEAMLRGMV